MGDFGRAGTASLWKSGPFFSTGTSEAKLMIVELRLNLRLALMRRPGASRAGSRRRMEWIWPQVVHSICRARPSTFPRNGGSCPQRWVTETSGVRW
jgi:hypothetical protein